MKKMLLLFLVILLAPALMTSAEAAPFLPAADDRWEYTDVSIGPGTAWYFNYDMDDGPGGFWGTFEVTAGSDISIFIVDQTNFDLWDAGQSFSAFHSAQDVISGSFKERLSSDGNYYFILSNRDAILTWQTVDIIIMRDRTAPTVDWTDLPFSGQESSYFRFDGTVSDAQFSPYDLIITIDWIDVYTTSLSPFGDFVCTLGPSDFNNIQGEYYIMVSWIDNVGNEGFIAMYLNFIPEGSDTDTTASYVPPTSLLIPILFLAVGGIVIGGIVCAKRRKPGTTPPTVSFKPPDPPTAPKPVPIATSTLPEADPTSSKVIERTTIEKIVLFMCPYCGAKNEQGITKCTNCQADL